jgi:hypothetical protein
MMERDKDPDVGVKPSDVNPGYAAFQIAKALTTSEGHEDPATRDRARERMTKWETVLKNILTNSVAYGSRTPVKGTPSWVTLEVVSGGFATGEFLSSGPLQVHEKKLIQDIPGIPEGDERSALNAFFLTDAGLSKLCTQLQTGCYDVTVPEEGALLVVAWLAENKNIEAAHSLLDEISPYFSKLRFYPVPLEQPKLFGTRVHLQNVGKTLQSLRAIKPNRRILAQKESVEIWLPLYDRIVALFLETIEGDWPCQHYPDGWADRALTLLDDYAALRKKHTLCGKMEQAKGYSAQLREFLGRCAHDPDSLTGREVGRIRLILGRYVEKRGAPNRPACIEQRRQQAADVSAPTFHAIAGVVIPRLEKHPKDEGLDDIRHLKEAVSEKEGVRYGVPEGTLIPVVIQRKVERCLNDSVDGLVARGLITSGEMLALILPQMTSTIQAMGIPDTTLRQLYSAIYRAFRCRRSLLLLNLEKQVQIEELPWIAAIEAYRSKTMSSQELAKQTLEEVSLLTLTSFPHAIIPNKLLQELRGLAKSANLDIPLVDELATDIFMGAFSEKFIESARRAGDLLNSSLYARYYAIDYDEILNIPSATKTKKHTLFQRAPRTIPNEFAQLCAARAGVSLGTWDPVINGMIIEQQQILTTQNLAALFIGLNLSNGLSSRVDEMARQCFRWICKRQQMKIDSWHASLIMLKNTAYAWRQMIFFLSLLSDSAVADFLRWADDLLFKQSEAFRKRFRPALKGLVVATNDASLERDFTSESDAPIFLGWSKTRHWLLPENELKNGHYQRYS